MAMYNSQVYPCALFVSYMKERCHRSSSLSYYISSCMLVSNIRLGGILSDVFRIKTLFPRLLTLPISFFSGIIPSSLVLAFVDSCLPCDTD